MPLVIPAIEAQRRIADFLHEHGVSAEVDTVDDGGADYGDLEFRAHVAARTSDTAITSALQNAAHELGPAFSLSFADRRRELTFYVRQPTAAQSYELEKSFRANDRVLSMPVWSPRLCALALVIGIALMLAGVLNIHALWHPYEHAYQTPAHYALDVLSVLLALIADLWAYALSALGIAGGLLFALRRRCCGAARLYR
jgi:hypothetical protein